MVGMKSVLTLIFLITLPNAAHSDEIADAAREAREKLLRNFSKEELATLSDDQIHRIIEMLPQARKIVRIQNYSGNPFLDDQLYRTHSAIRQIDHG